MGKPLYSHFFQIGPIHLLNLYILFLQMKKSQNYLCINKTLQN